MVTPSQTVARVDTFLIAVLPQAGQHHLSVNEGADARQSQCASGCFIGGNPCGSPNSITRGWREHASTGVSFLDGAGLVFDGVLFSRASHRHSGAFCLWSGRRLPFMHLPRPPPLALGWSLVCWPSQG